MMEQKWEKLLPASVRNFPIDLAVTVVATLATVLAVLLPVIRETPLRRVLGLPFLLFFPGYALIALLFPESGDGPVPESPLITEGDSETDENKSADGSLFSVQERVIDWVERLALSLGLSIAVIPLLALAITTSPFGFNLVPILLTIAGFTTICAVGAAYRRWTLSPEERFRVPYREWIARTRESLLNPENRLDAVLNVALALSIVMATVALVGAVLFPPDGERYTEFSVLTEDDDGDLVAASYPETMTSNESAELVITVGNQEEETMEYTVVIQLQRVESDSNKTMILEREEVNRFEMTIKNNETWQQVHDVSPTMTGEDLRLQYLLYRGDPPAEPDVETAYRDLHLWIDVEDAYGT